MKWTPSYSLSINWTLWKSLFLILQPKGYGVTNIQNLLPIWFVWSEPWCGMVGWVSKDRRRKPKHWRIPLDPSSWQKFWRPHRRSHCRHTPRFPLGGQLRCCTILQFEEKPSVLTLPNFCSHQLVRKAKRKRCSLDEYRQYGPHSLSNPFQSTNGKLMWFLKLLPRDGNPSLP